MQNKVIAHRGAWKQADLPQNSIASLQCALSLHCAGAEFDVQMTADEIPVVHHDAHFHEFEIERSSYGELLSRNLSNDEKLPTLEEYLRAGGNQSQTRLLLEIKPSRLGAQRSLALTEKAVETVRRLRAEACVEYISFDLEILRHVLALDALARVSYLKGDKSPGYLKDNGFYGLDYHFTILLAHPAWIAEARELDLRVNAWTVNIQTVMRRLLRAGVDDITTDEPGVLLGMKT